jgi:protease I
VPDYQAVLLIGGRAPEYLRNNAKVLEIIREFHAQGKWIFALCHGIQVLISAGLAKGRRLTAYEHIRYEIESNGGTFSTQQAVRDGKIVTAQTWQSHPEFYREIFACLSSEETRPKSAAS